MDPHATEIPAIRAKDIGISFGGIQVLRDITLDIMGGEIHGLVGENGAGKSTLGKILGGYYSASTGTLEVFGEPAHHWDSPTALARGVAIMHQELQLVPALTVAQNVFLGLEESYFGILRKTEKSRLHELMKSSGFSLNPDAIVANLSIADRQKIEIFRALARDAKVIVMDEPTSSLAKNEVEQLHKSMRSLRKNGRTVIYVSHFLDDILAVSDRITVLRDGALVKTVDTATETKAGIISAMLGGGQTETHFPPNNPPQKSTQKSTPVLQTKNLCSATGVDNVNLTIEKGEIVGLIGLVGSGRSEIARAIIGADKSQGSVYLDGREMIGRSPAQSTEHGMIMVPEDRRAQGLVMTMPVRANMTLPHLRHFSGYGVMTQKKERAKTRALIDYFRVRPSDVDGNVANYSGGNQQKVLIGKWLMESPKVVILDEPSRGVDIGARERIHEAIAELAAQGAGVLIISSEIDEVLGLAHRAYLVDRGRLVEEIDPRIVSEASVLESLFNYQGAEPAREAI